MIPTDLNDWTYEIVKDLVDKNVSESDRHDFKLNLSDKTDRLTKTCCSFANTKGGFIVLGIKDNKNSYEIQGIDNDKELAKKFGDKLNAEPTIEFSLPKIISIPKSKKIIAVFFISISPERPHIPEKKKEKRIFWKRTNKGDDYMTYQEIRTSFQANSERREKLKLLYIELLANIELLERMKQGSPDNEPSHSIITLDSKVLDNLLTDLYPMIGKNSELVTLLIRARNQIRIINNKIKMFFSSIAFPVTNQNRIITDHNRYIRERADFLKPQLEKAIQILEEKFDLTNPLQGNS